MGKLIPFLILSIFISSCAQKGTLSGGPKDINGPAISSATPEHGSTNFNDNQIILEFDEYIKANNFGKNVIVSPPLKQSLNYDLKGKKIILTWEDTLKDNTTYSFFFGEGIVDLNEGNPLTNNLFVFSTGEVIDSLSFSGNVISAEEYKAEKEMLVMLYNKSEDSVVAKELPNYFAKTDKSGNFKFNYLAPGDYKIIALKDGNGNYLYDQKSERIAFHESIISIDVDSTPSVQLISFVEKDTSTKIISKKMIKQEHLQIIFNQSVENFDYSFLDNDAKKQWWLENWSTNKDTVDLWFNDSPYIDSLSIVISANEVIDTLSFFLSRSNSLKEENTFAVPKIISSLKPKQYQKISFNQPIIGIDTSKMELFIDSNLVKASFNLINDYEVSVDAEIPFNSSGWITLLPNSFTNFLDISNKDTLTLNFRKPSTEAYGNLILNVISEDSTSNFFIEVYNYKGHLIQKESFSGKSYQVRLTNLYPGKYTAQIVKDDNKNSKWDSGNYYQKQQAESVYILKEDLTVRANWDLEVEFPIKEKK